MGREVAPTVPLSVHAWQEPLGRGRRRRRDRPARTAGRATTQSEDGRLFQPRLGLHLVENSSRDRAESHDALFEDPVLPGGRERLELRRRPDLRGQGEASVPGHQIERTPSSARRARGGEVGLPAGSRGGRRPGRRGRGPEPRQTPCATTQSRAAPGSRGSSGYHGGHPLAQRLVVGSPSTTAWRTVGLEGAATSVGRTFAGG